MKKKRAKAKWHQVRIVVPRILDCHINEARYAQLFIDDILQGTYLSAEEAAAASNNLLTREAPKRRRKKT